MKVRAIRLAECGRFREPVALEGLSGGLDIIAESNEFGKSTILKMLRFALTEKHSSKKAEKLKPYDGGAPTIEVDLDMGGQRYRLRKRYLAQSMTELALLDGVERLRGDEAEARLQALLDGPDGGGRFPLLWLAQGDALAPMTWNGTSRTQISAALARDIQDVASGEGLRPFKEKIASKLGLLMTKHAVPRPAGRYDAAIKRAKDASEAAARASERVTLAASQLARLEELRAREAALAEPLRSGALERDVQIARNALEVAREAAGRVAGAREAVAAAEQRLTAAARDLADFERGLATLAALGQRIGDDDRELADLIRQRDAARDAASAAKADLATAERTVAALEDEQVASLARERRDTLANELARLRTARHDATALEAQINGIARIWESRQIDERTVQEAQRAAGEMAVLEAKRAASATRIEIAYAPAAVGSIAIDGAKVNDGACFDTTAPIVLDIEGVGRVTVTPAASEDAATLDARLAAQTSRLRQLLTTAGIENVVAMEDLLRQRRAADSELTRLGAKLAGLAPEGVEALDKRTESVAAELEQIAVDDHNAPRASREIDQRLVEARAHLSQARLAEHDAMAKLSQIDAQVATTEARLAARLEQRTAAEAQLPPIDRRDDQRLALVSTRQTADARLNEATRVLAAWQEKAPDADGLALLAARVTEAEQTLARRGGELKLIGEEAARVEGELAGLRNEDVAAQAEAFDAEARAAGEEVAQLDLEVAALRLIASEIAAEEAATKDRFHGPVIARLAPYVDDVLPGARIAFGNDLAPEALRRGGTEEPLDRLSDGTREQIAVLSRLAFARLLADTGKPVPLILDDALVYSDDARIERMFRALARAATAHQVLVLTCRTKAFEGLDGNRVALTGWAMQ